MLQELAIEVSANSEDDGTGAGAGGIEHEVDEAHHVGGGLLGRAWRLVEGLGIEFLPLIDIEQEPVRAPLVGRGEQTAEAAAEGALRPTQELDLLLDPVIGREGRQVGWGWVEEADEGME